MRTRGTIFLALALTISMISYCIVLMISREAPIPYLAIGGFGALALIVFSIWGLWFLTDYEKTDLVEAGPSTDKEGNDYQQEAGAGH